MNPLIDTKLYEVFKFMSLTAHITDFFVVSINDALWRGLSQEEQGIMVQVAQAVRTASDWGWQAQSRTTATAGEKLSTLLKINSLSDKQRAQFAAATKPIYRKYAGLVGQNIMDIATKQFGA